MRSCLKVRSTSPKIKVAPQAFPAFVGKWPGQSHAGGGEGTRVMGI